MPGWGLRGYGAPDNTTPGLLRQPAGRRALWLLSQVPGRRVPGRRDAEREQLRQRWRPVLGGDVRSQAFVFYTLRAVPDGGRLLLKRLCQRAHDMPGKW